MSPYKYELATIDDEPRLRRILRDTEMPGHIALSLQREPDFFSALRVDGHFNQVVVARESATREIAVLGLRSVRRVFFDGEPADIGHIGGLRMVPGQRGGTLLARGYAFFRELHKDGRAPFYTTAIMSGNAHALRTITSGRCGLPAYVPAGENITAVIPAGPAAKAAAAGFEITRGTGETMPEILSFLRREGARRQFFPCLEAGDFASGALKGLTPFDFYVAWKDGRIAGSVAAWDQGASRQVVVAGYGAAVGAARPFYNAFARLSGYPRLPEPGSRLNFRCASFIAIAGDEPPVLAALLGRIARDCVAEGRNLLLAGFHSGDPLLGVLGGFRHLRITSRAFLVAFEGADGLAARAGGRPHYFDIGIS
ncbi:MAG: hypothetical protein Q7R35_05510 [Elusimicrobiota bacterium]|nr:hypothetical protein [Elusimicrobiota bacterium]